jgi:hypothetical protein
MELLSQPPVANSCRPDQGIWVDATRVSDKSFRQEGLGTSPSEFQIVTHESMVSVRTRKIPPFYNPLTIMMVGLEG